MQIRTANSWGVSFAFIEKKKWTTYKKISGALFDLKMIKAAYGFKLNSSNKPKDRSKGNC